ncbi:MAG TPA: fibronectin type III domain-containing protein, partial [Acidimicrobiales bacterium]|nr:fibronectin type III domain-containing protein [Acidimicrobiales bacterium]
MTTRRAAWVTLLAVAALLLGTPGPVAADDAPSITISEPGNGAVLKAPEVTVRGVATMRDLNRVTGVTVTLRRSGADPLSRSDCWHHDPTVLTGGRAEFHCTFALDHNGPYSVVVRASGDEVVELNGPESREVRSSLKMEAPPAPPRDVRVEVGPDRRVTISWARNSEPDLRNYQVSRVPPGGGNPTLVTVVPQPPSGERVSTVDGAVPPGGGRYGYIVTAVRPDGDGRVTSRATARSEPATVEVA